VSKPEWGTKRHCGSCGKRFYDLNRTPITCPQCGTVLELKKTQPKAKAKPVEAKAPVPAPAAKKEAGEWGDEAVAEEEGDEEAEELEDGDEEEDKDVIEDASDLGEDENDVSEVKEHMNSPAGGEE
jgi:uncharacterized protein (TIGR02300 family)